jgi:uncharacterized membrane protein YkoI
MQSIRKTAALAAMAIGLSAGSYGIASAASGTTAATTTATTAQTAPATQAGGRPWGGQRSDETLLTGDTLAKVQAAAVAKAGSGATVVRVETDADGHAKYEVHMTKADGTPETVYVDGSFSVVSVETR